MLPLQRDSIFFTKIRRHHDGCSFTLCSLFNTGTHTQTACICFVVVLLRFDYKIRNSLKNRIREREIRHIFQIYLLSILNAQRAMKEATRNPKCTAEEKCTRPFQSHQHYIIFCCYYYVLFLVVGALKVNAILRCFSSFYLSFFSLFVCLCACVR